MPDTTPANHEGLLRAALARVFERLDALASRFDLSPFERDLVLLCAGVALDPALAAVGARVSGTRRAVASFDAAAPLFGADDWRALPPSAPAQRLDTGVGGARRAQHLGELRARGPGAAREPDR